MTLKAEYNKLKDAYQEDAEQVLRVTGYRDGVLYMGSVCDQSDRRKEYWLKARDEFVRRNIKAINKMAHDMLIREIGEDV